MTAIGATSASAPPSPSADREATERPDPAPFAFPIMVDVRGRRIVVAGGGREPAHKAASLAGLGAEVTIWARYHDETADLAGRPGIVLSSGVFDASVLDGALLAIVGTGDRALDHDIATAARERRVLVNTVDDIPFCDWSAPAILRRGDLTISVASAGMAPALAVRVRDTIAETIGPEYGELLSILAPLRSRIAASGEPLGSRRRLWYDLVDSAALDLIRVGEPDAARALLEGLIATWEDWPYPGGPGMTGIVHLVGAGPGDPELLTLKARRLLDATDAVVHDRLIGSALLGTIAPGIRRYPVGKAGGGLSTPQAEIVELLIRLARTGADVVRLKGGDPYVFGRGGEEVIALREAGIVCEVIPGISAGIAGPAAAGIPVTHRGIARSVVFVTGETDPLAGGEPVDWAAIASIDTVVVFMAGRSAASIAGRLLDAGRDPATPVAVVTDATLPGQTVVHLDLRSLWRDGAGGSEGRPRMLVIGEVVRLGVDLAGLRLPSIGRCPREVVFGTAQTAS
jgi:uroporphyrin-III C-methyltransferase/precorrin-2 dehydrogenase/sirohydrochlorin ferrochelatase